MKKRFLFTGGMALLTATAITASCTASPSNSSEHLPPHSAQLIVKSQRDKSDFFIPANEKIRYVAIGDSITEGFDGTLLRSYPGKKEADGSISGVSYPAYLARLLNQNNRVDDFENFAISGSRLLDWLRLFNIPYQSGIPYENKNEITIFGKDWKTYAQKVKAKLKDANLVTFSLSANDMLFLLFQQASKDDVVKIVKKYLAKQAIAADVVAFFTKLLNDALRETQKRLLTFVSNLRTFAPKANINIISYPTPMFGMANILRDYVNKLLGGNFDISPFDFLINHLNNGLKEAAKRANINFIQAVNADYWNHNVTKFTTLFFDIHPNIFGYKKIAMDIYLKITNPSLNVNDYKNYDFSQQYLNLDADTANYEIQVKESNAKVLGFNTDAYLKTRTKQEQEVASERKVSNFSTRIGELTNDLLEGAKDAFNFLATNSTYKQLDPNGLLINLLNQKLSSGKNGKDSIIDTIINAKTIKNIIYNTESALSELRAKGQLTLDKVAPVFKDAVFNIENLALLIASLSQSELVTEHKDQLAVALKTILKNSLSVFKDKISGFLNSKLQENLSDFNFTKDDLNQLSQAFISSQYLKNLIDLLIDSFILNPSKFTEVKTLPDIIRALFSDENQNQQITANVNNLLIEVLSNPKLKKITTEIIYNFLKKGQIDKNITSEQVESVVSDFLALITNVNSEFKVFDEVTLSVLNHLKTVGDIKLPDLFTNAIKEVYDKFTTTGNPTILFSIIKRVAQSDLFKNHKDFAKQVVKNALDENNLARISQEIVKTINKQKEVSKYISSDAVAKLVQLIFKQPQIHTLLDVSVDAIIDNVDIWDNANNFTDIVTEIVKRVPYDSNKDSINAVLNNIINDPDFANVLIDAFSTSIQTFGLNSKDPKISQFINDLITHILKWINDNKFTQNIIDVIGESLSEIKTSNNPFDEFAKIPSKVFDVIKDKFTSLPSEKIQELISAPWISQNSDAAAAIIKVIFNELNKRGIFAKNIVPALKDLLSKDAAKPYLDSNEVTPLLTSYLQTQQGINFLEDIIKLIILNPNLFDKSNGPRDITNILLNSADFKNILNKYLAPLLIPQAQAKHLPNTVAKLLREFARRYNYNIADEYLDLLQSLYPSLVDLLNQMQNFPQVASAAIKGLSESENVDQIAWNIFSEISKVINFKDYEFWKKVIETPFISEHKDQFIKLLISFFNTFKTQDLSYVLETFLPDTLFNLTKEQLKERINALLTHDEFVSVLDSTIQYILDNTSKFTNFNTFTDALRDVVKNSILEKLYNDFIKNQAWVDQILDKALTDEQKQSLSNLGADLHLLKEGTKEIINDSSLKTQIFAAIDDLLSRLDTFKTFTSRSDLVQKIFTSQPFQDAIKSILTNIFAKLYTSNNFKQLLAKVLVKQINKTSYASIFKNIDASKQEKATELLIDAFGVTDKTLKLSQSFIDGLVKLLSTNGTQIELSVLFNKWLEQVKVFASDPSYEAKFIQLLNNMLALPQLKQGDNKDIFSKLLENGFELLINQIDFGGILWNTFGSYLETFVNNNLINKEQFTTIINSALRVNGLKTVIVNIVKYFIDHNDTFKDAKSVLDVIKKYLNESNNETSFKDAIKSVLKTALSSNDLKVVIKAIINNVITYLNIQKTDHITTFIDAVANDFDGLFDRTGVFDKILSAAVDSVKNSSDLATFVTNFTNNIKTNVNFLHFDLFKKVLNDKVISEHKDGAKELFHAIVSNLLNNEEKTKTFIKSINISSFFINQSELTGPEFINDAFALVLKDSNIRDLINLILSDFIDRATEYNNNSDWWSALNTLFKSSKSEQFKTKFTEWLKSVLKNPDPRLPKGLAQLLIASLKKAGFALNDESDLTLFTTVLTNLMKQLAQRDELSKMITHIYDNIKAIDFSKDHNPNKVKRAIMDGALYMILTDDKKKISLTKIVAQKDLLKALVDSIGDANYITLVNRLFESSSRENKTGIYKFIDNFTKVKPAQPAKPQNVQGASPNSSNQPSNEDVSKNDNSDESYGFETGGISQILQNASGVSDLVAVLTEPAFKEMIKKSADNSFDYTNNNKKNNPEYKFLFRLSALILWWIHDGAGVTGATFWNSSNYDVQGYWNDGLRKAFNAAATKDSKSSWDKLTNDKKVAIGATSKTNPSIFDDTYIIGTKSTSYWGTNNNSATKYDKNLLINYIFYNNHGNQNDKYISNKKMKDVLLEAIEKGYLGWQGTAK
ncbi:SGNH/GDSL hydrolase family protein [Mycoplasma sp. AC1221]